MNIIFNLENSFIAIGAIALLLPSVILITPPIFLTKSANNKTPSAPPLQKILPLVVLIISLSKRFCPPISNGNLFIAQPPLYRIDSGKKMFYAIDDTERDKIIESINSSGKLDETIDKKLTSVIEQFKKKSIK